MVRGELMKASLIHQVWEVIEQTQSVLLLQWNDQDMVCQLLRQVQQERPLNGQETTVLRNYLSDRTTLIRDVVADRRGIVY